MQHILPCFVEKQVCGVNMTQCHKSNVVWDEYQKQIGKIILENRLEIFMNQSN